MSEGNGTKGQSSEHALVPHDDPRASEAVGMARNQSPAEREIEALNKLSDRYRGPIALLTIVLSIPSAFSGIGIIQVIAALVLVGTVIRVVRHYLLGGGRPEPTRRSPANGGWAVAVALIAVLNTVTLVVVLIDQDSPRPVTQPGAENQESQVDDTSATDSASPTESASSSASEQGAGEAWTELNDEEDVVLLPDPDSFYCSNFEGWKRQTDLEIDGDIYPVGYSIGGSCGIVASAGFELGKDFTQFKVIAGFVHGAPTDRPISLSVWVDDGIDPLCKGQIRIGAPLDLQIAAKDAVRVTLRFRLPDGLPASPVVGFGGAQAHPSSVPGVPVDCGTSFT